MTGETAIPTQANETGLHRPRLTETPNAARNIQFADFYHQYVTQYIQLADAKAGAAFTLTSGVLAFLFNTPGFAEAVRLQGHWIVAALASMSFALLALSSFFSFLVFLPQLPGRGESLIFWKTVSELPSDSAYVEKIVALSDDAMVSERVAHCHSLATICTRKYLILRRAMLLAGVAIFFTFFYWLASPDPQLTSLLG